MDTKIKVMVVEDDALCRERFVATLNTAYDCEVVAQFSAAKPALAWLESNQPDVLLSDLGLPDVSGLNVIADCARRYPQADIMVITMYEDDEHVISSLEAGATGYLLKDSLGDEIAASVRQLRAGGAPISPAVARRVLRSFRKSGTSQIDDGTTTKNDKSNAGNLTAKELLVLNRVAQGFSCAEIAKQQSVSISTIQTHVKHIYSKLAVHSRTEAVYEANALGLLGATNARL